MFDLNVRLITFSHLQYFYFQEGSWFHRRNQEMIWNENIKQTQATTRVKCDKKVKSTLSMKKTVLNPMLI